MIASKDDLSQVSRERVRATDVEHSERVGAGGFAVTEQVWAAVRAWRCYLDRGHLRCGLCQQSVAQLVRNGDSYHYEEDELTGLTFAHLAQAHGWTRETVPIDRTVNLIGVPDEW